MGTFEGIASLNQDRFQVIPPSTPKRAANDHSVTFVKEDSKGGIWFGTESGGLHCWRRSHITSITAATGLPDNNVMAFLPGSGQQVWIGTDAGISVWDGKALDPRVLHIGNDHIRALAMDAYGALWIGAGGIVLLSLWVRWLLERTERRKEQEKVAALEHPRDLSLSDGQLRLRIQGDGLGFDLSRIPKDRQGLTSLRFRADRLGGTMELKSEPQRGTTVELTVPLARLGSGHGKEEPPNNGRESTL